MSDWEHELKQIEDYFLKAKYQALFEALNRFCTCHPSCDEFKTASMSILSRYNDLNDKVMHGHLELGESESMKRGILISYQTLMIKIRTHFHDYRPSFYQEKVHHFEKHRLELRSTMEALEKKVDECQHEAKSKLLWQSREKLNQIIHFLSEMIQNFKEILRYG